MCVRMCSISLKYISTVTSLFSPLESECGLLKPTHLRLRAQADASLKPEQAICLRYGALVRESGSHLEAAELYSAFMAACPALDRNPYTWLGLGQCLLLAGGSRNLDRADIAFAQAARLDCRHGKVWGWQCVSALMRVTSAQDAGEGVCVAVLTTNFSGTFQK